MFKEIGIKIKWGVASLQLPGKYTQYTTRKYYWATKQGSLYFFWSHNRSNITECQSGATTMRIMVAQWTTGSRSEVSEL